MTILLSKKLQYDEKAWSLFEEDRYTPNGKALHRYQLVRVIRDDRVAEFEIDLGNSANFDVEPFYIPSLLVHSVGEVLDIAATLRRDGTGLQAFMDDDRAKFNPVQQLIDETEMVQRFIKENPRTVAELRKSKRNTD